MHGSDRTVHALVAAAGGPERPGLMTADLPNVVLSVEDTRRQFNTHGAEVVTRGAAALSGSEVVFESAGGSGFDQRWTINEDGLSVTSRWRPSHQESLAARLLPARHRALSSQVLLQYPVLWFAMVRGFAPLHVSVIEVGGVAVLLAGPGGVGKSTLVARALADGARATCDNLAVCDGSTAYGVAEPLRLLDGNGQRAAHGRREQAWGRRVRALPPELVVVLRRGTQAEPELRELTPTEAARGIVAGTYAAGELRRFWSIAAITSAATGCGPVHPPIEEIAGRLTNRLPCVELRLAQQPGAGLTELLRRPLAAVRTGRVG
ncbi:hypothetical protein [Kribbella solani]|uniref:hypothetical protein n=1 Tax=Kribbella solani TaxID=236067 RepID=UPI0029BAA6CF|nr:hypothetical protein [Kribbella solani]MDX2967907.1 hypothetical protein [Kribbella solani]